MLIVNSRLYPMTSVLGNILYSVDFIFLYKVPTNNKKFLNNL